MTENLAATPEDVSALRAQILLKGANEIAKVQVQKKEALTLGLIAVALGSIHDTIGRSERDVQHIDERKYTLLKEAFEDVYGAKIKNRVHLFNEVRRRVCTERNIFAVNARDRRLSEEYVRRIAAKMTNGHAGVWV